MKPDSDCEPAGVSGRRTLLERLRIGGLAVLMCAVLTVERPALAGMEEDEANVLSKLRDVSPEELAKDPDRWREVSELLQQYVDAHRAAKSGRGGAPHDTLPPDTEVTRLFESTYRQMTTGLREAPGGDLTAKVLRSGLNRKQRSASGDSPLDRLLGLIRESGSSASAASEFASLGPLLEISSSDGARLLMRQVELNNRRHPNGAALNRRMKETLDQLKYRADRYSDELLRVERAAGGISERLAMIEQLVQQATALGSVNPATGKPRDESAKVAELRAMYASITATQHSELLSLNGGAMADRPYEGVPAVLGPQGVATK